MKLRWGNVDESEDSRYRYWVSDPAFSVRSNDKLVNDMRNWCITAWGETSKHRTWTWVNGHDIIGTFYFVNEQDMTLFLLKWVK